MIPAGHVPEVATVALPLVPSVAAAPLTLSLLAILLIGVEAVPEVALWADEGDPYSWIEGVGKTHRLSLYYGPPGATDATLLTAGPALALAAPEWYAHSGAFGPQITAAESGLPAVEQTLAAQMRQPEV